MKISENETRNARIIVFNALEKSSNFSIMLFKKKVFFDLFVQLVTPIPGASESTVNTGP